MKFLIGSSVGLSRPISTAMDYIAIREGLSTPYYHK